MWKQKISKSTEIKYVSALIIIFMIIISTIMIINHSSIWGSETDWINQHFTIPEYFRTRFYETGSLFPDFASQIGGGQNIYNFAYYGLMNPVYLPAYMMPYVTMASYIQSVSILSVLISCIMCYFLMRKHFKKRMSFLLSFLFMCSAPLIFHSHRHIMFVNYFPFLFSALFAVRGESTPKKLGLLIFSSYCILCSSFYFSISSFSVIITYAIFIQLKISEKIKFKQLLKLIRWKVLCIALGCISSGIFWIPTLFTLLNGREDVSSFINKIKLLIPTVNLQYLLYSSYSIGMTAITILAIIAMVKHGDKAVKFLTYIFICLLCCPIIIYICNGTMYIDSKILIPFIPILLIILGEFMQKLFTQKINVPFTILIFTGTIVADTIFNYRSASMNLLLMVDAFIVLAVIFTFVKIKKRQTVVIPVAIFALLNCIVVNCCESYVSKERVDEIYSEDIQELVDKITTTDTDFYRFANDSDIGDTVNRIYGSDYYTATVYSSVTNSNLRNFRFYESASENRCRNNALQAQPDNEIFNLLMGCRYRISKENTAMIGEINEATVGDYTLFRNNNALPIGYASANIMSEDYYSKLNYADKAEAMIENIIVPNDSSSMITPTKTQRLNQGYTIYGDKSLLNEINGAYEIQSNKDFSLTAVLNEPIINKLLFIQFRADNRIGRLSERKDISVTINGVKNKLSSPDWKYNNKNYIFTYVLSSAEPISNLRFEFSEGHYIISDFDCFILDGTVLPDANLNKDEFIINRETMGDDFIEGNISVTQNGWFNISVPYDKGFEIYVDGMKTKYFKTNTSFIGFPIEQGEHYILINYKAPYRNLGIIVTITGFIMSFAMCTFWQYYQQKRVLSKVSVQGIA